MTRAVDGMRRSRAVKATAWSAAETVARQIVQLATMMVLARLLTPADFGTMALLALLLAVTSVTVDAGFAVALIQRPTITPRHQTSALAVVLALGLVGTVVLELVAPLVAGFYDRPEVEPLLRVMATSILLTSLGTVPSALLVRQLLFRRLFWVTLAGALTSSVLSIVLAMSGAGVWALAGQQLSMAAVVSAGAWIAARWRPRGGCGLDEARELATFGGFMVASTLLDVAYSRAYTVVIGRSYGATELGYYARADGTQQIPVGALSGIVGRVALPFFSSIATDVAALRAGVRTAVRGLMLINAPMMLGLAAVAAPAVQALYGPQWDPAVPILRVLCLAGLLWPLHSVNVVALLAQGRGALMLRLQVVKFALGLVLLGIGTLGGVIGVAWASVAFGLLATGINTHYTARLVGYGWVAQWRDVAPVTAVAAGMAALVAWLSYRWQAAPWTELLVLAACGALLFLAAAWALRLSALDDAWRLLRGRPEPRPDAPVATEQR